MTRFTASTPATTPIQAPVPTSDFTGAMCALSALRERREASPEQCTAEEINLLAALLVSPVHSRHKRAHVLYHAAADLLSRAAARKRSEAFDALISGLKNGNRAQRMACACGLGCLPPHTAGPEISASLPAQVPSFSWSDFLEKAGAPEAPNLRFEGRSCLVPLNEDRILVVKIVRAGEDPAGLCFESAWMRELNGDRFGNDYPVSFHLPTPLSLDAESESGIYCLTSLPDSAPEFVPEGLNAEGWSLAYTVHPDYFVYPNDHRFECGLTDEDFLDTMGRNSRLLGHLAGKGVLHDAVIPLFHNRMQTARREDAGVYEWEREGRLDRWLESSRFPNIGRSGPRDFEHLRSRTPSISSPGRDLHRTMGAHILSLLLVAGSRFRSDTPDIADTNSPTGDFCDDFDEPLLKKTVETIAEEYCRGFSGCSLAHARLSDLLPDTQTLVRRMIEEMGADRYMHEYLRAQDQKPMNDEEFRALLVEKGMPPDKAASLKRGEADIALRTGPHLGDFNRGCSLPEIIEFAALTAGAAAALRFQKVYGIKTSCGD